MSTPDASIVPSPRRLNTLVDVGVTVVTLTIWLVLWQYAILANDDLLAAQRGGGGSFGQAGLAEIWRSYVIDYTERNGRAGDAITKAILAIGPGAWRIIAPMLLVLLSWVAWCTVRRLVVLGSSRTALRSPGRSLLAYGTISLLPFALIQTSPINGGSMVFFLAAVVGYVLSLILVFTGILLLVRGIAAEQLRAGVIWLATPCLLLAALTNEMSGIVAIAAIGAIGVFFPSLLRRLPYWGAAAGALAGLTIFLVAPGRGARTQTVLDASHSSLSTRVLNGFAGFWQSGGIIVLIALAVLWMLAVQSGRQLTRKSTRLITRVSGGTALALGAAAYLLSHAYRVLSATPGTAPALAYSGWWRHSGMLMLLTTLLCAILMLIAFVPLLRMAPVRALVPLAAMTSVAALLPIALGLSDGRPYFHALYLLGILAVAAALVINSDERERTSIPQVLSLAMVGGLVILAAEGGVASWTALRENFAVWQQGSNQLEEAAHGQLTSVVLPQTYPHPLWAYALSEPSEATVKLYRDWYGLDDAVEITWQR